MSTIRTFIRKITKRVQGFTLLETMVAVTLLTVAIVAPMSLTTQSLASAYYARDEITAFYLAQEGLEAVRNVRDNNILTDALSAGGVNLLASIPTTGTFTVDARNNAMTSCSGSCSPLTTDGTLYGYGLSNTTQFTRTMSACYVQSDGSCTSTASDEVKVTAAVSWSTGGFQKRTVTISENLYRWVADGSAT